MADVLLDTPIAQFAIPAGGMFDELPFVAYIRLSPGTPEGAAWWRDLPTTSVPLPHMRDASASFVLRGPGEAQGLTTTQGRVNAAYVQELAAALEANDDVPPWPPLRVVLIDQDLWLLDGNHRAAAAVSRGHSQHPAQLVALPELGSCPCGWQGNAGRWLRHECAFLTVT